MKKPKRIKRLTRTQRAYLAGIIDGEGNVSISHRREGAGTKRGNDYRLVVMISNTDERLTTWLLQVTGLGAVSDIKRKNPKWKDAFRWAAWSNQALQVLRVAQEFLLLKSEQANIAIEFQEGKSGGFIAGRAGRPAMEWKQQARLYKRLIKLNKRGPK